MYLNYFDTSHTGGVHVPTYNLGYQKIAESRILKLCRGIINYASYVRGMCGGEQPEEKKKK